MSAEINYFIIPGLKDVADDKPTREKILRIIANEKGVNVDKILTKTRDTDIIDCRFIYIKMLKHIYAMKKISIARELGKDHTTIMHALKQFDNRYQFEEPFKKVANRICYRLGVKLNNE